MRLRLLRHCAQQRGPTVSEGTMNRFEAEALSGNFEFEADQEFEGTQFENAQFGEAEFNGGELEGEWDGEVVRDHRRRPSPTAAPRVRGPAAYRSGYRPSQWSSRSRSYATPRSTRWGTRTSYGSRPSYRSSYSPWSRSSYRPWSRSSYGQPGQRYRWGQPGLTSGWYRGGQYPGRYWRFGQGQRFPGATSQWGTQQWGTPLWGYWDRRGRWRRRHPYGRYGTGGSAYGQPSYDEPTEPPYEEPPMPPPVIVAAPPPPPPQPPMAEPPPETPPGDPNATTTPPPAQDQATSGEFFIEPESFEFEPELDRMFEESSYEADFESEAPGSSSFALLRAIPDNADYARFVPLDYRLNAKAIVGKLSTDLEQLKDPSAKDLRKFAEQVFKFVSGGSPVKVMLNILVGALKNIPGGYLAAAAKIADDWAARGFSRGVVLGADGRPQSYLIDTFGREFIPPNHAFPYGRKIAAANYGAGLIAGYVQGKVLSKNQQVIFWRDLGRRMGDQSYRGARSTWRTKQWQDWYVDVAAAFRRYHL
jgi:hypothetical protein